MRQPVGPRVPIMSGNGAGVWIVVLACWGLAAVTWLAWLAARIAAALTGGDVPSYGVHWVYTVLRGRTAQTWPGTPTVLVVWPGSPGLRRRRRGGGGMAVYRRRLPRPEDPVAACPATRRSRSWHRWPRQGTRSGCARRWPRSALAGCLPPIPGSCSATCSSRPAAARPCTRRGKTPRSRSWRPARGRPPRSPSRTSCPRPARSPRPASARTCGPRPASCAPGPGRCGCSTRCG